MVDDNNNEELSPQPKPFPVELMVDIESETVAHAVRDCLWGKGPIDYGIVSAHMRRDLVSKFVGFEMPDLPPVFFWRVRILADLYNLKEHLEYVQSLLNRQEKEPDELERSMACTIILAEIGDSAQKSFAYQYYEYLVAHRFANEKFEGLIQCLAALGPQVSPDSLRTRMENEIKALAMRESADPEAGVDKRAIEDLINNEFFFIDEANASRRRISAIEDSNARILEVIRAYFELTDDGGAQYIDLWIQQQIRRASEALGPERIIESFRMALRSPGADSAFVKVRSANAIEYFLGKLNPEETEFMVKNRKIQIDPLRYMPLPLHIEDPMDSEDLDEDDEEEVSGAEDE